MNNLRTSLKSNKKIIKIILFLLLLSFIISFIIYQKYDSQTLISELKSLDTYLKNNLNYIYIHIIIVSFLILATFTVIGIIILPIYIIFELICLNFTIFSFLSAFKIKGLIYSFCYIGITKLVYIILLLFLMKKLYLFLKSLKVKDLEEFKFTFFKTSKGIILIIFFIIINDLLIYFFAHKILAKLLFII